jgi:energy-coupling factor transporter ATP-binding protein EcfA2
VKELVYLIGEPGAGKSTLMCALTDQCARLSRRRPFAHDLLVRSREVVAVELGRRRAAFSGTDALALSVEPAARSWIAGTDSAVVLGEGDRLATAGFLDAATEAGFTVTLVHCAPSEAVAHERRRLRGSPQDATWVRGRRTKTARLAERAPSRGWRLLTDPCTDPPDQVAARLAERIPALEALR